MLRSADQEPPARARWASRPKRVKYAHCRGETLPASVTAKRGAAKGRGGNGSIAALTRHPAGCGASHQPPSMRFRAKVSVAPAGRHAAPSATRWPMSTREDLLQREAELARYPAKRRNGAARREVQWFGVSSLTLYRDSTRWNDIRLPETAGERLRGRFPRESLPMVGRCVRHAGKS